MRIYGGSQCDEWFGLIMGCIGIQVVTENLTRTHVGTHMWHHHDSDYGKLFIAVIMSDATSSSSAWARELYHSSCL